MRYKFYENYKVDKKSEEENDDIVDTLLSHRGVDNPEEYRHLSSSNTYNYRLLDNISEAIECFDKHFNKKDKIAILVDTDVDGYTSAAIMYDYIKCIGGKDYDVNYIIHKKVKSHGLGDDVEIPEGTKLFIIPDAGTNDYEECNAITKNGIDVIILDHHDCEVGGRENLKNKNVFVVNNQMSENYPNKNLSGVGVVYKFLQGLDEKYWEEYADEYLDLVALGNISDVMDMREPETKYYVERGLSNIVNKEFKALLKAQEFSTKGVINMHSISWYITPVINGCVRFGSLEEQELLFRAFIEDYEEFDYKKRGRKEPIKENIYDRAARLSKNAKSRQDKSRDKAYKAILETYKGSEADTKVAMVNASDYIDQGITGVVAIKVSENVSKPCILLKEIKGNEGVYGGSGRNYDHSPVENFKDIVQKTGEFELAQGHPNAFGIQIKAENIDKANEKFNKLLKNVEFNKTYYVDDVMYDYDVTLDVCMGFNEFTNYVGQGLDEPMITVMLLKMKRADINICGSKKDTWQYTNENGIKYVMFRCSEDNPIIKWCNETWNADSEITINIVGRPGINDYNGIKTPQVVIEDIELVTSVDSTDSWDEDEEDDDGWAV